MPTNVEQEIGRRLQAERLRLGHTQKALAELADVSKTTQANYETGFRCPDARYLARGAELGLDVLYIVTGQQRPRPELLPGMVGIPPLLHGARFDVRELEEPRRTYGADEIAVRQDWLAQRGLQSGPLRAARVRGTAMQGAVDDGDLVVVDLADQRPRGGHVYAALQGDEVLWRYVTPVPGGALRVSAAATSVPQFDVPADAADFRIIGRVVATLHEL